MNMAHQQIYAYFRKELVQTANQLDHSRVVYFRPLLMPQKTKIFLFNPLL